MLPDNVISTVTPLCCSTVTFSLFFFSQAVRGCAEKRNGRISTLDSKITAVELL